ncbi:MAG: hypothetical protein ACI4LS_06895 [Treponema sp.]
MANRRKIILFFLLIFSEIIYSVEYLNLNNDYLGNMDMRVLEKECLSGNIKSTNEFIDYLQIHSEYISDEVIKWEEIAAENEVINTQNINLNSYNYALSLIDIKKDEIRAIYWMQVSKIDETDYSYKKLFEKYSDLLSKQELLNKSEKIEDLIILAKLGSIEASEKLHAYFNKIDDKDSLYWCRIGAQNGSKKLMKLYYDILSHSDNENDLIRSYFWKNAIEE